MSAVDRTEVLRLVTETVTGGGTQAKACEMLGVTEKTVQRWRLLPVMEDRRQGPHTVPANKLSNEEREKLIAVATSLEFRDVSPHQIIPRLADRGEYLASESTLYRVLKAEELLAHRGRGKPREVARPRAYEAIRPCQLFSWDITYLRSQIAGKYFYLYLFLDVFSRKAVGYEVHDSESAEHSSKLLTKICIKEGIQQNQLVVHADNGGAMKGATILVTMQRLGVMPSFSRPSVSNDNPFSESLFKTLKYCPLYPSKPFASIDEARAWVAEFITWYNTVHLHSGIGFTTPASRHSGEDTKILEGREVVYKAAKEKMPKRWSGKTRNWKKVESVKLNWLKEDEASDTTARSRFVS